jgi:hypothetical protein
LSKTSLPHPRQVPETRTEAILVRRELIRGAILTLFVPTPDIDSSPTTEEIEYSWNLKRVDD